MRYHGSKYFADPFGMIAQNVRTELLTPVMINTKAIKADGELLVYRAPKRKVEGPPASVKVAKLMKDSAK